MSAGSVRKQVNEFPRRKPIMQAGRIEQPGDKREELKDIVSLDSFNTRLPIAVQQLQMSQYQYFRRAKDGADSFFRGFGIALLEHYCRKTTPHVDLENFRKWVKMQRGVTRVRAESQEDLATFQTVLDTLSEDKRANPGLSLFQLQNVLPFDEFDNALVKFVRMVVMNALEDSAQLLRLTSTQLQSYQQNWQTKMPGDETVKQAAAWGFCVNMKVEDCVKDLATRTYASGSQEARPVLSLLQYRRGFAVLYPQMVGLIDGYSNGEFGTDPATSTEQRYARESFGIFS